MLRDIPVYLHPLKSQSPTLSFAKVDYEGKSFAGNCLSRKTAKELSDSSTRYMEEFKIVTKEMWVIENSKTGTQVSVADAGVVIYDQDTDDFGGSRSTECVFISFFF